MSSRLMTCRQCPNVKSMSIPGMRAEVFYCTKNDAIVPHRSDSEKGEATFWRVPEWCPRPASEVAKSSKAVAKKHWETITVGVRDGG